MRWSWQPVHSGRRLLTQSPLRSASAQRAVLCRGPRPTPAACRSRRPCARAPREGSKGSIYLCLTRGAGGQIKRTAHKTRRRGVANKRVSRRDPAPFAANLATTSVALWELEFVYTSDAHRGPGARKGNCVGRCRLHRFTLKSVPRLASSAEEPGPGMDSGENRCSLRSPAQRG